MKNKIILIYGMPASGKLTMAQKLADKEGYQLIDNHYFHDFFKPFVQTNNDNWLSYFKSITALRKLLYNAIIQFHPSDKDINLVFTAVNSTRTESSLIHLKKLASEIKGDFIPIKLIARDDVLKNRCISEYRITRKKICDKEEIQKFLDTRKIRNIRHKNLLTIDVSDINEEQTFRIIKDHLNMLSQTKR